MIEMMLTIMMFIGYLKHSLLIFQSYLCFYFQFISLCSYILFYFLNSPFLFLFLFLYLSLSLFHLFSISAFMLSCWVGKAAVRSAKKTNPSLFTSNTRVSDRSNLSSALSASGVSAVAAFKVRVCVFVCVCEWVWMCVCVHACVCVCLSVSVSCDVQ